MTVRVPVFSGRNCRGWYDFPGEIPPDMGKGLEIISIYSKMMIIT